MSETKRTNLEFLIELIRVVVDFNSQVTSIATVELAGEQSGRNRTHQKKVVADFQILAQTYNMKLERMYEGREAELRDEAADPKLDSKTRAAVRRTVAILNDKMKASPNRELADVTNYLQVMLEGDDLLVDKKAAKDSDSPRPAANCTVPGHKHKAADCSDRKK